MNKRRRAPKKKILVITGTRAEYGLLRSTLAGLRRSKTLAWRLLVTGMHTLRRYGHTIDEIKRDRVPIAAVVPVRESDDMLTALSREIMGIKRYCERQRPDLILVLGDRDEPFAGAIVGGHLKIPLAHIHGGDVTSAIVDEYIRHSITKFSHLHFTASPQSYQRVIKLGEEPWRVHCVGAPGIDALRTAPVMTRQALARALGVRPDRPWLVLIQHPAPLDPVPVAGQISPTLRALTHFSPYEKLLIYPNSDEGSATIIKALERQRGRAGWYLFRNIPHRQYLNLLREAAVLVGNSSSGIIESTWFQLPAVNIGPRQQGRECGRNVLSAGYREQAISAAITRAISLPFRARCRRARSPYGDGRAGNRIVRLLERLINHPRLSAKKFTYA
ncbi:MAG: UDP-N-acetylglucosamine 2-epimerase (hydrolyzing) [Candidatus Magasanikbacteria bacterium]|nr:UDP-N-acetylglucosamine 2-epimerase (hydrolyzing) [Candidatus Magasanikbacteria bacterium]